MKNLKLITLFAFTAILFMSCKKENTNTEAANNTKEIAPENLATASFTIDGMTCPDGCAKVIENKLAGLNGVSEAKVDFENKKATITFDNEKQTPEALAEIVEKVGGGELYKVSDVKSSTDKAYYNGKDKKKKKKSKKGKEEASTEKNSEKKSCCAGKSSCGEKKEAGTL
ncbi:heavy-metal-associated domain-containing protein [Flavobacterium sp. HNIBRBA15423]|uniref:heavy-metal-associated domain-containing protein n=1 Tax=Flavobacterium sp. HNIBRBA15423 TaxID=3458683 RepID=UPI00404444B6